MTDTPSPKPVTAWAVVDKDGVFDANDVFRFQSKASDYSKFCNEEFPSTAPHRVVEVTITPKENNHAERILNTAPN